MSRTIYENNEYGRLLRKGDRESELASLAARDGDKEDAARHFAKAREYWRLANEAR